jgi:drug/metabolite transporter (DMT)-like permease
MLLFGYLSAVSAALVWGLVYTIDQKLLGTMSPLVLLFVSSLLPTLLLIPAFFWRPRLFSALAHNTTATWSLLLAELALAAIANLLIFASIQALGATTASVVEVSYPLFVVIFSSFAFHVKPTAHLLLGSLLIVAGAMVIAASGWYLSCALLRRCGAELSGVRCHFAIQSP